MAVENTNVRIEQILSQSKAIYIIDASGILLHHEIFFGDSVDADLFAGLFSALSVYARELRAGNITNIGLGGDKFVLKEHEESKNLIIIEVNQDVSTEDATWLLEQIVSRYRFMENLLSEDYRGNLTLETLFSDKGKIIDWETIERIREDAVQDQKRTTDRVETLNLARVNISNKLWVKLRKISTSLVANQQGVIGILLYLNNKDHLNKLYSGRGGKDRVSKVMTYIEQKFYEGVMGLELETEYVQIDDLYIGIFNIFIASGGILAVASIDKFLLTNRMTPVIERFVASIEKLAPMYNI